MNATVLLYHDVVAGGRFDLSGFQSPDANIYKLDCEEFDRHLAEVEKRAPLPVTCVNELAEDSLLITFDDGGKGAILHTADPLERRGWRGHFFITTDYIGAAGFMSAAELRELHARGHVIGSHSCSHPARMAACPPDRLDREWSESVARLTDILGTPVTTASIPGGYYGANVARSAAGCGIRHLFTSEPVRRVREVAGCRVLGRFSIQQGVRAEWVGSLVAGDIWPRLQQRLFWDAKKVLKIAGGSVWLEARKRILARRAL